MNKKKNHNSIIFLTTLGVYLGLVLVGGTPQVFSHAALTRDFDIRNEIEFKDDLDNKPDDEINFAGSIESYFEELEDFIQDLQKLHSIEKFDLDYDTFEISELGFVPCDVDGDPIRTSYQTINVDNRWLEPALTDARYRFENWNNLSDCFRNDKYKQGVSTSAELKIKYDKSELEVQISVFKSSAPRAEQLAGFFNEAFKLHKPGDDELIVKTLNKNTSFSFKDTQVFIVTRLPRASIDKLLAKKVAN